jgi:hypothetical protein
MEPIVRGCSGHLHGKVRIVGKDISRSVNSALSLPNSLKNRILTDHRLSLHQKFVLFTLYYLDSIGKLAHYQTYVPKFLNLAEEDFQKNLTALASHNYLRVDNETLRLNIRPLHYRQSGLR